MRSKEIRKYLQPSRVTQLRDELMKYLDEDTVGAMMDSLIDKAESNEKEQFLINNGWKVEYDAAGNKFWRSPAMVFTEDDAIALQEYLSKIQ